MRKLLALAALFGLSILTANASLAAPKCGDLNNDGKLRMADFYLIKGHLDREKYPKGSKMREKRAKVDRKIADVNLDGRINKWDADLIWEMVKKEERGDVACLPCPANRRGCKANENPSQNNGSKANENPSQNNGSKAKENPSQDNGRSGYLPGFL